MDLHEQRVPPSRWSHPLVRSRRWRSWPAYQQGRWGYILAWALGVPVPLLIVIYLLRGCT